MAVLPQGSIITLTKGIVTATVAVTGIKYKTFSLPFQRPEFMHNTLIGAKEINGALPIINLGAGNIPVQYFTGCGPETLRDPTPDDTAIDDIYKRFDIKRYELEGAITLETEVDKIYEFSKDAVIRRARFDAHFEIARGNVSIGYLLTTAQAETFSFITATGLTFAGRALGTYSPESNCLITDFEPDVTHEYAVDAANSASTVLRQFKLSLEVRTLVTARSLTY